MQRMGWSALLVGLTGIWLGAPVARGAVPGDRTDLLDVHGKFMQADQVDAPLTRNEAPSRPRPTRRSARAARPRARRVGTPSRSNGDASSSIA